MNDLVLMTFGFLLPLVPACLLYKLLPSETKVEGPWKGLNLQLSGSFAGYFLLTLMAFGFIASRPAPVVTDELWQVRGKIGSTSDGIRMHVVPGYNLIGDGTFIVDVPAKRDRDGKPTFPTLVIEKPEYETRTINLNGEDSKSGQEPLKLSTDLNQRAISVTNDISLKPIPVPYKENGTAPTPVSVSGLEVPR